MVLTHTQCQIGYLDVLDLPHPAFFLMSTPQMTALASSATQRASTSSTARTSSALQQRPMALVMWLPI